MTGRDVKAFQRALNQRYATWKIDKRVREDGRYEAKTKRAAHQVAYGLGIAGKDDVGPLTPGLRALIRNPSRSHRAAARPGAAPPSLAAQAARAACGCHARHAGSPAHGLGGRDPRPRRPLRADHRQRSSEVGRAGVAGLRRDREGDALHQRVRARHGRQPRQEPTPAGARPRGHGGAIPEVPRAPQARPGQPGRRADAAHEPRACRTVPTSWAAAGGPTGTSGSASSSSRRTSNASAARRGSRRTTALRATPTPPRSWRSKSAGASGCASGPRRAAGRRRRAASGSPTRRCAATTSRPSNACSTSASRHGRSTSASTWTAATGRRPSARHARPRTGSASRTPTSSDPSHPRSAP